MNPNNEDKNFPSKGNWQETHKGYDPEEVNVSNIPHPYQIRPTQGINPVIPSPPPQQTDPTPSNNSNNNTPLPED